MTGNRKAQGFTLLEILTVVAVIAILGAIAVIGYQSYVARARASEIVLKYDAIRSAAAAALASGQQIGGCAELAKRLGDANLKDDHARLAYGFEAVAGGYRPVLTVCAQAASRGQGGVDVARGAHETLSKSGRVEKGAVITSTLVSFALPLSESATAACTTAAVAPAGSCGAPLPPTGANPQVPAQAPSAGLPGRAVPPDLKAGSTPNAPWLKTIPAGFGVAPMQDTWTDKDLLHSLRAQSPDGSAMTISRIDVDPSLATVTRDPDGTWRINFLKSHSGLNPPPRSLPFTSRMARARTAANSTSVIDPEASSKSVGAARLTGGRCVALVAAIGALSACAAQPVGPTASPLMGSAWELHAIQSMDDAQGTTRIAEPQRFTIRFEVEGRASLRLDCNRGTGTWKAAPTGVGTGSLAFGPIAATRELCPPPHLDERVARDLAHVRSYRLQDGRLFMSLMADGGIYEWHSHRD